MAPQESRFKMRSDNARAGFALSVAVFALVVVGVLVTGGFYLARQETRIGVASQRGTEAFYMAERGAMEVMSEWDMSTYGSLASFASATQVDTVDGGNWSVTVTKMSSRLYFLLSTGKITEGSGMMGEAQRMLGMIVRLNTAEIEPRAALSTVGEVRVQGSMEIIGTDSNPSDWGGFCDSPGPAKPGILIDDTTNITEVGNALTVEGDPLFEEDPTLTPDSLLTFGDLTFDDLKALADITIPHRTRIRQLEPDSMDMGGGDYACNTSSDENWGTPEKPGGACGTYFPVIYAEGDLDIAANEHGQGILLVEGDLEISGSHVFYGPVIIRGTLWASGGGTGGHFMGGVIAANVVLEETRITGNAMVEFSSCAVSRAVLNNSSLTRVRPIQDRSWVDLSSVIGG